MKVRVLDSNGKINILSYNKNDTRSLLELLWERHISMPAPCGGKGNCGHCQIQIISGKLDVTEKDKKFLSKTQLDQGYRLACQAYPSTDLTVRLSQSFIHGISTTAIDSCQHQNYSNTILAIDLGTTTIAYALVEKDSNNILQSMTSPNPQNTFGSDVMSRMEASNQGHSKLLAEHIRIALRRDINKLLSSTNPAQLKKIIISGNTVMIHLLMNYSCKTLSKYPFTPISLDEIQTTAENLSLSDYDIPITVMPGLSSFVGGDLFSGLVYIQSQYPTTVQDPWLLLDLGTNAEIILCDGSQQLFLTSAPAGPAFEGGNISCGIGAVNGAIHSATIKNQRLHYETIHNQPAAGLCGSGLIELIYELWKNHIIDETGLYKDEYFEKGYEIPLKNSGSLFLKQEDIRAFQMAKSATSSAIKVLLKKTGLSYREISKVYLAGGFGKYLNLKKAAGIGLLPHEWISKTTILGNSSLKGAIAYSQDPSIKKHILSHKIEEFILSNETCFTKYYYENMYFPKS